MSNDERELGRGPDWNIAGLDAEGADTTDESETGLPGVGERPRASGRTTNDERELGRGPDWNIAGLDAEGADTTDESETGLPGVGDNANEAHFGGDGRSEEPTDR